MGANRPILRELAIYSEINFFWVGGWSTRSHVINGSKQSRSHRTEKGEQLSKQPGDRLMAQQAPPCIYADIIHHCAGLWHPLEPRRCPNLPSQGSGEPQKRPVLHHGADGGARMAQSNPVLFICLFIYVFYFICQKTMTSVGFAHT